MPRHARLDTSGALPRFVAITRRSKEELGIFGVEIARYLGVNISSINRILAKKEDLVELAE
jgi:hypothetical protein